MINDLIEKALKRREQWQTIVINSLPDPYTLKETTLLGSYSFTKTESKQRLIVKRDSIWLTDHDTPIIETPSAIARDYLKIKYKRSPIVKHVQANKLRDGLNPSPNYANPTRFEYGYYIDIKSAYWSIMDSVGWNPDYYPERWLSSGTPPRDFPFKDHKIARNCLVSAGFGGGILRYTPAGVFDEMKVGNQLANISLYRLINDILNSIAQQAVKFGAVYVNTDGYIAPNKKAAANISQLILDWGLTPSIKAEGRGEIKSSGAYKVGQTVSVPFKMRKQSAPVKKIYAPKYSKWLQDNFSRWVAENTP